MQLQVIPMQSFCKVLSWKDMAEEVKIVNDSIVQEGDKEC